MANYLGSFPTLECLCELFGKNTLWIWDVAQDKAFNLIKAELAKLTLLSLYDVNGDLKIFC